MAYIGTQPIVGQYRKLDSISASFNGSATAFTMQVSGTSVTAGSAQQLLISLGGIVQEPGVDFTVSGSTLTFTTAPASGLSFFGILMGDSLNIGTPSDGAVTTSKLASDLTVDLASGTASAPSLSFDSNTGLYSTADNEVAITTDGTYRAKVDSSGRLLVGTSSSRSWLGVTSGLQVESTSYNNASVSQTLNSNDSEGVFYAFIKSRGTSNGSNTIVQNNDSISNCYFAATDGNAPVAAARIQVAVDGTPGSGDMPGRLVFYTTPDGSGTPTERMRISNNGVIDCFVSGGEGFALHSAQSAGNSLNFFVGYYGATGINGTASYIVRTNGNVLNTNGSYTAISDQKLKENIVDANSQWNDLKAIKIRNWNFKEETGHETHRQIGPIAQELEQVCPGLVFEVPEHNLGGEAVKGVNQSVLYMKAVKALQEAMERIEQLEAEMAEVKAQLS